MKTAIRTIALLILAVCDKIQRDIESGLILNKLAAIALILCTIPVIVLDNDATATVFMALIAVPMFFSKERWIY